jgi:20S proteasome alpha/beta subunit
MKVLLRKAGNLKTILREVRNDFSQESVNVIILRSLTAALKDCARGKKIEVKKANM